MPEDKIQICTSCGAEQSYTQADAKLRCEFCKNEIIIIKEGEDLPSAINVKFIVPLSINDKELTNLTHKYMSEGKHTPDDLIEKSRITEQKLFYVPTHLFRGSYIAQWTAMFGFDRLEPYTAYETQSYQTNNGQWHQRRVAVTKYRVVTDWHPASGTDSGGFAVQVYSGSSLDQRAIGLVENIPFVSKQTEFKPEFLTGFPVQDFIIDSSKALGQGGNSKIESVVAAGVHSHARGDHQRDWRWSSSKNIESQTALMPLAKSVFEYEGKSHTVWFDGSNPSKVAGDALPVDSQRKKEIKLGFIPFWASLLGLVISNAANLRSAAVAADILTISALIFGIARRSSIIRFSKSKRSATLTQTIAASSTNQDLSEEERAKLAASYVTPKVPGLANTSRDKVLLTLLSGLSILIIVLSGVIGAHQTSNSGSYTGSDSTSGTNSGSYSGSDSTSGTNSVDAIPIPSGTSSSLSNSSTNQLSTTTTRAQSTTTVPIVTTTTRTQSTTTTISATVLVANWKSNFQTLFNQLKSGFYANQSYSALLPIMNQMLPLAEATQYARGGLPGSIAIYGTYEGVTYSVQQCAGDASGTINSFPIYCWGNSMSNTFSQLQVTIDSYH